MEAQWHWERVRRQTPQALRLLVQTQRPVVVIQQRQGDGLPLQGATRPQMALRPAQLEKTVLLWEMSQQLLQMMQRLLASKQMLLRQGLRRPVPAHRRRGSAVRQLVIRQQQINLVLLQRDILQKLRVTVPLHMATMHKLLHNTAQLSVKMHKQPKELPRHLVVVLGPWQRKARP